MSFYHNHKVFNRLLVMDGFKMIYIYIYWCFSPFLFQAFVKLNHLFTLKKCYSYFNFFYRRYAVNLRIKIFFIIYIYFLLFVST